MFFPSIRACHEALEAGRRERERFERLTTEQKLIELRVREVRALEEIARKPTKISLF